MTEISRRRQVVLTPDALSAAIDEFYRAQSIGVDTEANSFFVYRERTCLVQVSTLDADFILDPLSVDLAPFARLLADPAVEKIFHACEYDVLLLKQDFGVTIANLFDTSIAAKAVGFRRHGLANLVEEILKRHMVKDEQRSDWGRRPLSAQQIEYAYADTQHLIELAWHLKREVCDRNLEAEVAVDCGRVAHREFRLREYDPNAFERHPAARKMDPVSRRILKELYDMREARARELDKPPFRIISDDALGEIAVRKAATRDQLRLVPGITPVVMGRHGQVILSAVERALALGGLPFQRRVAGLADPFEEDRYEKLRAWRRKVAEERSVEVEVIANNAVLKAIAHRWPRTVGDLSEVVELDHYRRDRYGEAIVTALAPVSEAVLP